MYPQKNIWPATNAIQKVTTVITVVLSFRDQCSGSHIQGGYLPRSSVFQSFQMSQKWNTNSTNILIQYGILLRPCISEPSGNFNREEVVKEQVCYGDGQHYPQRDHDVIEGNVQRAVLAVVQLEAYHDLHGQFHHCTGEVPALPPNVPPSRCRSEIKRNLF